MPEFLVIDTRLIYLIIATHGIAFMLGMAVDEKSNKNSLYVIIVKKPPMLGLL